MGAYAQCAERLIERGFAAVPIMPGTKRPGFFFAGMWIGLANWQRRFNSAPPPESERERWAAGNTGVGVVAGQASHGLIAVDIDSEDPAIQAALRTVLPPTHVRKTGARGETLFYYSPGITQSQSWNIAGKRVVDHRSGAADGAAADGPPRHRGAVSLVGLREPRGPATARAADAALRHRGADHGGAAAAGLPSRPAAARKWRRRRRRR